MTQQPRLPLWFLVVNWGLLVVAFASGAMLGSRNSVPDLPEPHATAISRIHAEILRSHVDPPSGKELLNRAIAGMVDGLDEYSKYVSPEELAAYVEHSTGRYEGVGMVISQQGEELVLLFPFAGSAAERAGVQPGDRLLAIDGKLVAELPVEGRSAAATDLVRGAAGTSVVLRIARGDERINLSIGRAPVQRQVVKWAHLADQEKRLGYVYLSDFHPGATAELAAAIERLGGTSLRGLILDLRFNGGGSLDECADIARLFVREGVIVSLRRRDETLEEYRADPTKLRFADLPLVVLVNGHSASASEVLAGALQDHRRAAVVGARTFGKGFVNTVYSWPDLPLKLKLTTAHYYTPNGRNIDRPHGRNGTPQPTEESDKGGIFPDVAAETTAEQFSAYYRQLSRHETPPAYLEAFREVASKYGLEVPAPPTAQGDLQFAAALRALDDRIGSEKR
ncbi:MAG: hypothetical protein RL398_2821 [Planctomycetota bacterium]|jgi:carboxyl-terminal processing protease